MDKNFYIDQWLIQPSINRVALDGKEWRLEPKIMQVLCILAKRPNEVVSRDFLFDTVWKDTVVVDMVLTRAISELRTVFNDSPTAPRVIETIPKGGYRLIAPVRSSNGSSNHIGLSQTTNQYVRNIIVAASAVIVITLAIFFTLSQTWEGSSNDYDVKPLTALKGWEFHPDISADGKAVAFVWQRAGENYSMICTKNIGANDHKVISTNTSLNFAPSWSPDGSQIAFYSNDKGKVSVNMVPAYGGKERTLIQTKAQVAALSWSPDGQQIAFVDFDSINNQHIINLYSISTHSIERLVTPPKSYWGDSYPRYSPDGKQVAFVRTLGEGVQELFTLSLKTRELSPITDIQSSIYGFDWTSNSELIFSSDFDGQIDLWKTSTHRNANIKKVALGKDKQNPSVVNGQLVVEEWNTDTDIFRLELNHDTTSPHPLLESTFWDLHPDISSNGKKIVFTSNQSGNYEIWSANANGKDLKKLTQIERALTANPKWSPKGDMIAFDARPNGLSHIYLIDSAGMDQYQFTKGEFNALAPNWSSNGDHIYYGSDETGNWEIWKKPINGNKAMQVTRNGGYAAKESKDGKTLFYTKFKEGGIWHKNLQTGNETLLIPSLAFSDWSNWTVLDQEILYIRRSSGQPGVSLMAYNLDTRETKVRREIRTNLPKADATFAMAPDGSFLLFGHIKGYKGDLIYVSQL